jgi:outer membrane protein OmpA-like peptidoglycan-associated protein
MTTTRLPGVRAALLAGLTVAAWSPADAADAPTRAPATQRNFVACPVVRDTRDIPCWTADYQGETYYLTPQTGRSAGVVFSPQLKHRVLVEGTLTDQPRICGGVVLKDVKLSVFPDVDPSCNTILPDNGMKVTGPRPLGPDGDPPGAAPTRRRPDPAQAQAARKAAFDAEVAARKPKDFIVTYFFGTDYLPFPVEQATVDQAADYANAVKARKVEVTGYRGQTILSDGRRLTEESRLAQSRATTVAAILKDFGVAPASLAVTWKTAPEHAGGVSDYRKRRTVIRVTP